MYELDRVICGGDCTGKMLIPLVEQGEGSGDYLVAWGGDSEVARGEEAGRRAREADPLRRALPGADLGSRGAALARDPERLQALFRERMLAVVGEWTALAEERLGGNGTQFVMTPGNDDEFDVDEVIQASDFVDAAENRIIRIGPHEMLSVGWSNPTPWDTPRECSEEELAAKIDALAAQIEDMDSAIFNIHVPPFGTGLDNAPQLDDEPEAGRGRHGDGAGRLDRGPRLDPQAPAAARPARAHPRVARGAETRPHHLHQPRQRLRRGDPPGRHRRARLGRRPLHAHRRLMAGPLKDPLEEAVRVIDAAERGRPAAAADRRGGDRDDLPERPAGAAAPPLQRHRLRLPQPRPARRSRSCSPASATTPRRSSTPCTASAASSSSTARTAARPTSSSTRSTPATTLELADRLEIAPRTIPPADLLLSKLQVVETTPKDYTDAIAVLSDHEVVESDGAAGHLAGADRRCLLLGLGLVADGDDGRRPDPGDGRGPVR